jgi:hypothetical protein
VEYSVKSLGERKWGISSSTKGTKLDISGEFPTRKAAQDALTRKIRDTLSTGPSTFGQSRRRQAGILKGMRTRLIKQKGTTPPPPSGARKDTITTFTEQGLKGLPASPSNEFMERFLDEHFPIAYSDAADLPAEVSDQLKVRISRLSDEEREWATREAKQQYREEVVAARGLSDEYKEINSLNVQLKELNAKVREAKDASWRQRHSKYPRSNLNAGAEDYLDAIIEKFDLYATFPTLYKSLKSGTPISKKEMKELLEYCKRENLTLPIVPGVTRMVPTPLGTFRGCQSGQRVGWMPCRE